MEQYGQKPLRFWDLATLTEIRAPFGNSEAIPDGFTPDGKLLTASWSLDKEPVRSGTWKRAENNASFSDPRAAS